MKVYLGPYPDNHWTTRYWAEKIHARRHGKEFGFEVEEEDYDWVDRAVDKFASFWQDVLNLTVNKIARHRKRKLKVHVDSWDVWGADHTLALIIHPVLLKLKEVKRGSPWVEDEDVPHMVKKKSKTKTSSKVRALDVGDDDEADDVHARWAWVLDEMIYAFECEIMQDDWEDQFTSGEMDTSFKEVEINGQKMYEWVRGPNDTYKVDEEARKAGWERRNNGLRLFAKYYHGLWD